MKADSTRQVRIRKAFAIGSLLAGIGWLAMTIIPPVLNFFSEKDDGIGLIFLFTMIPFLAIPGLILLWFGHKLLRERTEKSLRAIVGTATFLLIAMVGFRIGEWIKPLFPNLPYEGWDMLLLALATAMIYPLAISRLLPIVGGEKKRPRSFISKGMLSLIALLTFFSLSAFQRAYLPLRANREFVDLPLLNGMIDLLISFSPMLIPYFGYRLALRYLFGKEA